MEYYSIVLAAGKGTRMKSDLPKVIHEILGISMINLALNHLEDAGIFNHVLITGYKSEKVLENIISYNSSRRFVNVLQHEQLGTGHAVKIAKNELENKEGISIITYGDTPLVSGETLKKLIEIHKHDKNDLTILSSEFDNPFGYGRILRDKSTTLVMGIVEEKDANEKEKNIKEINSGVYCIDNKKLFQYIDEINNSNVQGEYYITDLVEIFKNKNLKINAIKVPHDEVFGVNDLSSLEKATRMLQKRINNKHMSKGIEIIDSATTYIGDDVKIGVGTKIFPNNVIMGKTEIGEYNSLLMGNNIENSTIGNHNQIGPMTHLRQDTRITDKTRVGNYVELKNVLLGKNSKVAHLTYLGDATVGEKVNIGCGVITANYDGKNKYKTVIGDNVFVGSNSNLIAPITVKKNTFIAAGSTVTEDIDQNKFVIGRSKIQIKEKKE